jgi:hypothetical protein
LGFKSKVMLGPLTDLSAWMGFFTSVDIWHPAVGLSCRVPNQILKSVKSVKGPSNTFDLNPKWERTLPFFGNFLWDIYSPPPKKKSKYHSWYLTPYWGL